LRSDKTLMYYNIMDLRSDKTLMYDNITVLRCDKTLMYDNITLMSKQYMMLTFKNHEITQIKMLLM
jgi:hypothetical protein